MKTPIHLLRRQPSSTGKAMSRSPNKKIRLARSLASERFFLIDRYCCAVASGQSNHSKWHGNAARRGREPDRIEGVPCAIDGIGCDHRGIWPYFEARLCRPSAGRSLAHARTDGRFGMNESRFRSAGQAHRRHEVSLQGVWRSGLSGSLDVDGRSWALSPRAESGVWLTWRRGVVR